MARHLHPWTQLADYTLMRCLYCGKELALLKRLTGNGEFCSDQHKQSYHDEYNRLALSRLLQAQTKTEEGRAKSSGKGNAGPAETASPSNKRERGPAMPVPVAQKMEPVATVVAGFLPEPMAVQEGPHPQAISPSTPFCWTSGPMLPAFSQVQPLAIETAQEDPPLAGLLEFAMEPVMHGTIEVVQTSEASPFENAPNLYVRREGIAKRESFDLPLAGPVAMPGIDAKEPVAPELWLVDSQPFFPEVFQLLTPPPKEESVELPAEAAELLVADGELALAEEASADKDLVSSLEAASLEAEIPETSPEAASPETASPETDGSGSEDLDRLQRELRPKIAPAPVGRGSSGRRTESTAAPVVDGITLQGLFGPPPRRPSGARVNVNVESTEGSVAILQMSEEGEASEPVEGEIVIAEATAPFMEQLIPITLRIVAPAKAKLVSESRPLMVEPLPQLGAAETLPLRPKIGVGKPPAGSEAPPVSKTSSAVKVKQVRTSDEPGIGSAQGEQNEKPFDPREAVLAVKRSINVPESKSPPVRREERKEARREEKPATAVVPAAGAETKPEEPPKAPKPAETTANVTPEAKAERPASKPEVANAPTERTSAVSSSAVSNAAPPSFEVRLGASQQQSALSKLPLGAKIAIAVGLLLALGGGGYLVFFSSGKSRTAHGSEAAQSALSVPSLLVGEGGWITDWAGDTTGHHKGRKISVYRPSLNLTNYKIEFQGRIETNAVGWVFRASNASNFYSVKLAAMESGYRLLKYAVVNGKEKEMGQVPVRPVDGNTFPIRVEVRGNRFTTYIGTNPVDVWMDDQLKSGGVGFVNDRGDRAEITKVGISLLPSSAN
jgi:hypothetical protein